MLALDFLAEQKLAEAVSRGELDDLPGAGKPLDLDEDTLIPEELRVAYRILKNAGFVPAEVQSLNEISQLERMVLSSDADAAARSRAVRKLALLRATLDDRYYAATLAKLAHR